MRLELSAGITTGEVNFREVAAAAPGEFALIGPAIDLAMHLTGQAHPGQILTDEATYRRTKHAFDFQTVALASQGRVAEGERIFNALADGGKVLMPLQDVFWVERWGSLVDRFGTPWMVVGPSVQPG